MPEAATSRLAVYRAWPTIRVNGREEERLTHLVTALEMTEQEDGLSTLELRLSNVASERGGGAELAFEDESSVKLGDELAIYAGDQETPREIFRGVITGLEAAFADTTPPELTVLAEDKLQQARLTRRTKTYDDTSPASLAREIAGRLGLTPKITGFSDTLGAQVQLNESDLAFLRRVLARHDGDVQVVGDELHVSPRADVQRGTVELELHSQLKRVKFLADLAHQVTEVTVTGWNAARGARITGRSRGAQRGPGSGRTGAEILERTLGARPHQLAHLVVTTDDEARAVADTAFDARQRRFVCVEGTAEGNAQLRVGTHITLRGVGPRFGNTYYLTRCCHRFDRTHGYETDFTAEGAFLARP